MNVHFVIHESFEELGALGAWVQARGHRASYSRVYDYEPLPQSIENIDMLIVLGGPQSPLTTKEECPYFDGPAEMALMNAFIEAKKAVVGICLGSQMLGTALGAAHEASPQKEIGKFPIELSAEGLADPLFSDFGQVLEVGHWHYDMPGLTKDAVVIAGSDGCPRQIIRYGDLVYGIQCHLELTPKVIEKFISKFEEILPTLSDQPFVQQPGVLREQSWQDMNKKLFSFLDKLLEAYAKQPLQCE